MADSGRYDPKLFRNSLTETKWGRFNSIPRVGSASVHRIGEKAVAVLDRYNIGRDTDHRLRRALRFIESIQTDKITIGPDDGHLMLRASEAQKVVLECHLAAEALNLHDEAVRSVFLVALDGPDVPDADGDTSRDRQFELFLAAFLSASTQNVRVGEPDILFELCGEEIGVAAKRIWNPDQLRKRLSIGADQIERTNRRGLLAVNVDTYVSNARLPDELQAVGEAFNTHISRLHGHGPWMLQKPHVLGFIAIGTVFTWDFTSRATMDMSTVFQWYVFADNDQHSEFVVAAQNEAMRRYSQWCQTVLRGS